MKLVRESLSFERGNDPKKSMKLGSHREFTSNYDIAEYIYNNLPTILELSDIPINILGDEIHQLINDEYFYPKINSALYDYTQRSYNFISNTLVILTYLVEILKKNGYKKHIKESLSFERGVEPKQSMGIGLEKTISDFMNEQGYDNQINWISYLTGAWEDMSKDLEEDTRKKWINFLLSKPEKYVQKNSLDENDYTTMKELGIHWIPYVPLYDKDLSYIKENDQYYLFFNDWTDFDWFVIGKSDENKEFVTKILEGDSFNFFDYDGSYYSDIEKFRYELSYKLSEKSFEKIKNKAIKLGADINNLETLAKLINEIDNNELLEPLKKALIYSISDTQGSADEAEAFKFLIKSIKNHYKMGNEEWIADKEKYKIPISFEGLEDFSLSHATGENRVYPNWPRDFSGDWSAELLNDSIDNYVGSKI